MSLVDIIKEMLNRTVEDRMQEGVEAVKDVYTETETEEEAIQKATDRVIKEIEARPDMPVIEFLKMIQKEEKLPTDIVVEATKQMPDVASERITVEAVKELDLGATEIKSIIEEADVSFNTARRMADEIPDEMIKREQQKELEKKQEQETLKQLQKIYDTCEGMNDNQLVHEIKKIKVAVGTKKIEEKVKHIVARRTALDCMEYGGPKIPTMAQLVSPVEMLEINFPFLVEKEYQSIRRQYDEQGKEYHEYDVKEKWILKMKILDNIARIVARNFEEIGDISVPQSEQMRNLSDEELKIFTASIKSFCKKEQLNEAEVERIKKQVRGDTSAELEDVIRMLERMKSADRERYVLMFKEQIQEKDEKTKQDTELNEAIYTLQQQIKQLPKEDGIKTATMMSQILQEKQEAREMIKKNRKTEEGKGTGTTQSDDEDEYTQIH